jgi:hypothetical protein
MKIRVEYGRDEIQAFLLVKHVNVFGEPPEGDEWVVTQQGYGDVKIENFAIKEGKRVVGSKDE